MTHSHTAHQDAGKDIAAVRPTLATMRQQYADILSNVGVSDAHVQCLFDMLDWSTETLLKMVEERQR